jgi:TRAP-type C4-dicarboxylate transport system substrate-binding protein
MSQTKKIRWLIAHEPVNLFLRTAEAFSKKIAELTNGKYEIEIFTPSHYFEQAKIDGYKDNLGNFYRDNGPIIEMEQGNIEISQVHINELAMWCNPNFWALELPFLFNDHDHATRVFEGPIGKGLLDSVEENSPAKGMAFTYSGGFRCVVSETPIDSIDDLKGLTYAVNTNPVAVDTVLALGGIPESFSLRDYVKKVTAEGFNANLLETTIPRYLAQFKDTSKKHLLNTKHSLFLTSIIISKAFWESLDSTDQAAFEEACLYASQLERKWSVNDSDEFAAKENHDDIGATYQELSEEDTAKFKELTAPLYDKYQTFFYPGLIDGIIKS